MTKTLRSDAVSGTEAAMRLVNSEHSLAWVSRTVSMIVVPVRSFVL